jgi:hypothetical protein
MSEPTQEMPQTNGFLELTLTNRDLLGARQTLGKLALYKPKQYTLGYRFGKNADEIEQALKRYFDTYTQAVQEYGIENERGEKEAPKPTDEAQEEAYKAFSDALEPVLSEECKVNFRVIPTGMLDKEGDDFPLTVYDLSLILFMLSE